MNENLQSKKEQLQKIEIGNGVRYILDEACNILGNPILAHDLDYKVINYTENTVSDDPIWNELKTTGRLGYDRLIFYRDECFFYTAANAKKATFLVSDKLKYDRICGKLFTDNNLQVGFVSIVECYRPFVDGDPELFEIVCGILNKEFCDSKFFQNYGQAYMEALLGRLIENSLKDIDLYIAHIESLYNGLKSNLRLTVVDISRCNSANLKLEYFRDLFKLTKPEFKYAIYSDYIVIIMSSDNTTLHAENLTKLLTLFDQHDLHAGMSRIFENILELPQYYKEAVGALNHGLANGSGQRLFLYDDMAHEH